MRPPLTVITVSSVTELEIFCLSLWTWAGLGGFFVGIFSNQEEFFLFIQTKYFSTGNLVLILLFSLYFGALCPQLGQGFAVAMEEKDAGEESKQQKE